MNGWNKATAPLSVEDALECLLACAKQPPGTESVSVYAAAGRILAVDYTARLACPPFDRSPLDGYAMSHTVFAGGVSQEKPVALPVSMKLYAGDAATARLEQGCAARIMTGAMLPPGADCVVRQEDTDYGEERVLLYCGARAGENICRAGEDIAQGERLAARGEKLTPAAISLLAAQGYGELLVYRRLRVGVVATGSELVPAPDSGAALECGKIYDSNGPMVCARLAELGLEAVPATEGDDEAAIAERILALAKTCDAVVTTGGVSVGQRDCLPAVMERLGADLLFHGVAMKPGSPMLAALVQEKPVFALSGNPFAALATLELLALPVLLKLAGRGCHRPVRAQTVLLSTFEKKSPGRRFLRGLLCADGVRLPEKHASGTMESSRGCNCLVDIPAGSGALAVGDSVNAVLFLDGTLAAFPPAEPVPVFAVSGFHKTGKTTVLEETIAALSASGCVVGVIKHDGHGFAPDVPGTDSHRLKAAGAAAVMVYSNELQGFVQDIGPPTAARMVARLLAQMERRPDIILLEGFKSEAFPRLLLEGETDRDALRQKGRELAEYLQREILQKQKGARQ